MSFKKFFNCREFSDCQLVVLAEKNDDAKQTSSTFDTTECNSNKRRKLEKEFEISLKNKIKAESNVEDESIVYDEVERLHIHSLLFCSKSEYFHSRLSEELHNKVIKVVIERSQVKFFVKLIEILYDDSLIQSLAMLETLQILKLAQNYQCQQIEDLLSKHLCYCKVHSIESINEQISVVKRESSTMLSKSFVEFLKEKFCPLEKVFGYLLQDFLKMTHATLMFFLENITAGIARCEENAVSLVMHWIHNNPNCSIISMIKLFELCRFNDVSIEYIINIFRPFVKNMKDTQLNEFYIEVLEYHSCKRSERCIPDFSKFFLSAKPSRTLNFARDHEVILFFQPIKTSKNKLIESSSPDRSDDERTNSFSMQSGEMFDTVFASGNIFIFSEGYQVRFKAGINIDKIQRKELQVQLFVENIQEKLNCQIDFTMLYSIASHSVSWNFSPWSQVLYQIESPRQAAWKTVSLIADHSMIHVVGFYLWCYLI